MKYTKLTLLTGLTLLLSACSSGGSPCDGDSDGDRTVIDGDERSDGDSDGDVDDDQEMIDADEAPKATRIPIS